MSDSAPSRVFLHVGTPKTGTTYLQDLMWRNRIELRRRGVCYPGDHPAAHFLAVMDLQGTTVEQLGRPDLSGAWERLVRRVTAARGTVVVSHELLSPMRPDLVQRVLDAFGGTELHVVCTARDLGRQLPAVWQEDLKNRHTLGFAEFLDAVRDPATGHWLGGLFWRMQDVPDVLRRWAGTLPPHRVHVITVPPPGAAPGQLWQRFATVLGVRPDGLDGTPAEPNRSLGPAEAQLLRRLNLALPPELPWPVYAQTVRRQVVDVLARRPAGTPPVTLPPEQLPWVTDQAKRMVAELTEGHYRVVGDLDELLPTATPPGPDPDAVTEAELLDVALDATRDLVLRYGERITPTPPPCGPGLPGRLPSLRQRIRDLSGHSATMEWALGVYRAVRGMR